MFVPVQKNERFLYYAFFSFKVEASKDLSKEYSGSSHKADEKVLFPRANLNKKEKKINERELRVALLIILRGRRPSKNKERSSGITLVVALIFLRGAKPEQKRKRKREMRGYCRCSKAI